MIQQTTQTDVGMIVDHEIALKDIQTLSVHLHGTVFRSTDRIAVVFILASIVITDQKLEQTTDPTTDRHA